MRRFTLLVFAQALAGIALVLILSTVKAGQNPHLMRDNGSKPKGAMRVAPQEEELFSQRGPIQERGRTIWDYKLVITETEHTLVDGSHYKVWAYAGRVPGPTLIARENDWIRIQVVNETSISHTIHSHGLYVPQRMDGVVHSHGSTQHHAGNDDDAPRAVEPGTSFTYEYIARPAGTHFYHCHVNTNEHMNRGMSGALIILPRIPEPRVDHDIVMLLQEWNTRYARGGQPGNPREVNDYDIFTINGKSYPNTDAVQAGVGETVRIRFINAGAQPHFMHLHGHSFLVTHKDGAPLAEPMEMDTVAVGPGERVDILILANNPGEWPLHCHTVAHQTNAGAYPGGMMTHLKVGKDSYPTEGEGPVVFGMNKLREIWRRSARERLGITASRK